jgi:DNA-binding transcriptional LysR family regulator
MSEFDNTQIRKLDGGLLLVFRELLLRRRATEVANHLGLSPSAISHALTRLRDVFGDPLFIRRSHGLEPTQRAIELGPRIDAVLAMMGEAVSEERGFDAARSRRRFRIVCPDHIATLLAAPLVEAFRREAPRACFSTRPAFLERALRAVRRGEAEVALGVFDHIPQGFVAQALFEDDYCVIARGDHPTIRGAIDLATYARIGHVFIGNPDGLLADEASFDREAMRASYGELPGPEVMRTHAYFTQWESAMLMVSESDVLADCPRRMARRFAGRLGLQIIDPPYEPFRFTVQAVRRAEAPDAGVDWLLERIAAAFN